MLSPGTLVDRYELVAPVGEGGMAQVWVARQKGKHGFEKLFAFKCIHTRFADHPAFRSMFLDEARIAASIEHPNVAQVFDLGEWGQMLYLVMEYVDGESLGALMAAAAHREDRLVTVPTGVALRVIADACAGLHAAHKLTDAQGNNRGVVHRDVSPQNILVSVRGDVKVIDFGIALAKDRIGGDTAAGSLKGKLHYMAPEQALREDVGPFTDVFAMGATLYRMLSGRPPHDGGNDAATLHLLLNGGMPPPLPPQVPELIAAIVNRALDRDPGERYQTALAFQTALESAMVEEGYVADVATWVTSTLSDGAKQRRANLATRTLNIAPTPAAEPPPSVEAPSFIAELGPAPVRTRPVPAAAPPPAPAPAPAAAPARAAAPAPPPIAVAALPAPIGLDYDDPPPSSPAAPPPPSSSSHSAGPGMLDVRALVARAGVPGASAAPAARPAPSNGSLPPAPPSQGRAGATGKGHVAEARDAPRLVGPSTKAQPESAGTHGGRYIKYAVGAIVLVLVIAGFLLVLPMIVKDRILASAREAGIELTIDRIGIGLGGVALKGVTAKAARVPGGELHVDEVFASGFSAREVRVRGADVKLSGDVSTVGAALLDFYESNRSRLAGGSEARKVSITGTHITWDGFVGEGSSLEAGEVGCELESRAVGSEDIRATIGRFEVKTKRTTFGPWAGSFERNPAASRLRFLFDPPVPDGPSMLVVWGKGLTPKITVRIPRSPLARLGIHPDQLGLPGDVGTELEVKFEVGQSPTMRYDASLKADIFGLRLKGLKSPVDVKIDGTASGLPGKPLDLEKTTMTVGPFLANVTGTLQPTDTGFRLDAAWRTVPVACEKLARAEAKSMGPIAAALQEIAHTTGAARVTGTAQASGIVKYDSKTPDEASATSITREACGLSIFGL